MFSICPPWELGVPHFHPTILSTRLRYQCSSHNTSTGPRSLLRCTPVPDRGVPEYQIEGTQVLSLGYPPAWASWDIIEQGKDAGPPARIGAGYPPKQARRDGVPSPSRGGYVWTSYPAIVRILRFHEGRLCFLLINIAWRTLQDKF